MKSDDDNDNDNDNDFISIHTDRQRRASSMHRHRQRVGKLHIFIKYIMRYGWNDIYYCNKWTLCARPKHYCNTIENKVNKIFSILSTLGFGRMRTRPHNRFWLAKSLLFHLRYACVCLLRNNSLTERWRSVQVTGIFQPHIITYTSAGWLASMLMDLCGSKTLICQNNNSIHFKRTNHFAPEFCVRMHSDSIYDLSPASNQKIRIIFDINKLEQFN